MHCTNTPALQGDSHEYVTPKYKGPFDAPFAAIWLEKARFN